MTVPAVFVVWAFTIQCLVSYIAAYSHGASLSACPDMSPQHIRAHLQNPQNNYIAIHTNMSFFPGDKVPVTVRSTRNFMGFMLQARSVSSDQITGTFVHMPPGSKLLACFEDGDTVTHSDKSLKRNLSFVWKAPDQPVGDIRFFLSVVKSYLYWARTESSIVYQQTPNSTKPDQSASFGLIKPAPLQELRTARTADRGGVHAGSAPHTVVVQFAKHTPISLTSIAATLTLNPASIKHQDFETLQSESLANSAPLQATSPSANGKDAGTDFLLESSLQFQDLGFTAQAYSTRHSTYNGAENTSSISKILLCLTCTEDTEEVSGTPNLDISKSAVPVTPSPLIWLWDSQLLSGTGAMSKRLDSEANLEDSQSLSVASRQMSTTQKVPENFPLQAELPAREQKEQGKDYSSGNTFLKVTRAVPKTAAPEQGGDKPGKKSQLVAAQLGVLLGCSAILGMALAIGLRCIHSQYCHKRTEVSFSEPDNNVVALRENGQMMHFRKIRENSFVLVQAEYNWINPSGSGKKAVM